jgi:hypothetical protein
MRKGLHYLKAGLLKVSIHIPHVAAANDSDHVVAI